VEDHWTPILNLEFNTRSLEGQASELGGRPPRIGGWLVLDPFGSLCVPHPFTTLVKGAGVEFDFDRRLSFLKIRVNPFPSNNFKKMKKCS